ncbi:hypothetical protein Bbelb_067870 [Branchiostoma belcheri]|nr:hypothetical protein Bbelb_067870 [Branchiostoma belcheri]
MAERSKALRSGRSLVLQAQLLKGVNTVRMAERSKALRSGRSLVLQADPRERHFAPLSSFHLGVNWVPDIGWGALEALDVVDTFHVHSVAEDTSGRCVCTVMAPSPDVCSDDNKYHYIKELEEQVANLTASIQILANRTTAAVDIQSTVVQIQQLNDQLNVLQADREQLLTDQFTSIRDEIIALAALLPQLEQDRDDAKLLQLYQNQLANLTSILGQLEGQHGVNVQDMQQQVLQLTQQLQACQQNDGFQQQQTVAGRIVSCANTNIEDIGGFTAYTCHDIKVNGARFPNGVSCDPDNWNESNSIYTDHLGFCNKVLETTGQRTTKIQAIYTCDSRQPRAVWWNGAWATDKQDNGYTVSLRCLV